MGSTTVDKKLTALGFLGGLGTAGVRWWELEWQTICRGVLLCFGYFGAAQIGLALRFDSTPLTVIWLPNGLLLTALLLAPRRHWWFYLAAMVPAHLAALDSSQLPFWRLVWQMAFNSGLCALVAIGLRRFGEPPLRFDRMRQVVVYVLLVVGVTAVVCLAPTRVVQELIAAATGEGSAFGVWIEWRRVYLSNLLAFLLLTPVLLLWANHGVAWVSRISIQRLVEASVIAIGLLAIGCFSLVKSSNQPAEVPVLLYALFPFLLWTAVRFGPLCTGSFLLAVAMVSVWMAVGGYGPFGWVTSLDGMLALQLFLLVMSIPLISLATANMERRSAEARYRDVVESQTDLVCRYLPDTTLTFVNETYCRTVGRKRDELIGQKFLEVMPVEAREGLRNEMASIATNGRVITNEHEITLPDRAVRWRQWVIHAITGPDGTVTEFQAIGRDITERKQAEQTAREFSGRLIQAQEAERARLARELHDDITQRLARLAIDAGRVESGEDRSETMRELREGLVRLSEDIHTLSYRLHPSMLGDLGLAPALKAECERFSRNTSIATEVKLAGLPPVIPPDAALCLFRIAQESLRNIARHSGSKMAQVSLRQLDGGLHLAVMDNGAGFDPGEQRQPSLGLASMRERVRLLGGELEIETAPGQGTIILAWVPLEGEAS